MLNVSCKPRLLHDCIIGHMLIGLLIENKKLNKIEQDIEREILSYLTKERSC